MRDRPKGRSEGTEDGPLRAVFTNRIKHMDLRAVPFQSPLYAYEQQAESLGESGMLGVAAAIANAIEDAVGVRVTQIPFTPERVLAAIEAAR